MALIEVENVTKTFRRPVKDPGLSGAVRHLFTRRFITQTAVDGLDLTVDAGEAVAYVGPNGAGKSTTIKMLTGIMVPSSGTIRVDGLVPYERRIDNARRIGVVFGQRTQLWWDLPVRESLALVRDMYGVSPADYQATIKRFDEVLGIDELMPVLARKLSLGQRMRADLAAALLHRPGIVYLDEPTIGLDIAVKDRVRAFIRQLVAEGVTVMLTTHDLGDIEDLCRRIVIIDSGRRVYDGALESVKDTFARDRAVHFQARRAPVPLGQIARALPDCVVEAGDSDRDFTVSFDRFQVSTGDVLAAVLAACEVADVDIDEPAIEDVIRKVYAGDLTLPLPDADQATEAAR